MVEHTVGDAVEGYRQKGQVETSWGQVLRRARQFMHGKFETQTSWGQVLRRARPDPAACVTPPPDPRQSTLESRLKSENSPDADKADEEKQKSRLIKRHAKESWIYPIASVVLGSLGLPFSFFKLIADPLGLYCLIRSYINIKNGNGKGIVGHVVAGTILNLLMIAWNVFLLYAIYISRKGT